MPNEKLWIEGEGGELYPIDPSELDPEILPKLCRPVGHFSYRATDFLSLPLAEAPYYVQGWLPKQGRLEIYGGAKAGKSFLCMQLARCVASGEPFLTMPTAQGRVLYIQCELGPEALQDRFLQTHQEYDEVYVGTTFAMKLDTSAGQAVLNYEVEAVEPNVLILDPLYKLMGGDENEAQDVLKVLDYLDNLIDAHPDQGLSVVIIHHAGKDLSRGGRGSSVLEGWVDSCIEMRRVIWDDELLHAQLKPKLLRHAHLPPESVEVVLGPDFEFTLGEKPKTIREKVADYFVAHKQAKMQELVEAGVGSRRSVYDARSALLKEGKIEEVEGGLYKWKRI